MSKKIVRVILDREGNSYRVSPAMHMTDDNKIHLAAETITISVENFKGVAVVGGVRGVYTDNNLSSVQNAVELLRSEA